LIRLAAVLDSFDLGGYELACLELLSRLDRGRFDPRIYTFRPGELVARARDAGLEVTVSHDKPPSNQEWTEEDAAARLNWAERLPQLMRSDSIDLCFVWSWPEAIDAARDAGITAIVERVDGPSLATRVADKSACTRVVVESRNARDQLIAQSALLQLDPERIAIIRNGVDLEEFDPSRYDRLEARRKLAIPSDAFVVGALARLAPEKNLALLVRAFAEARHSDARFGECGWLVVAGPDAGSTEELEQLISRLGIGDRVVMPGPVVDRVGLLGALDVYASTSYVEGTPASILEAMAVALPIIATPVGGVLEMLDQNAIVVDVIAPRATAQAMVDLFGDADLRSRMSAQSRVLAREWGMDVHVRAYEELLEAAWAEAAG